MRRSLSLLMVGLSCAVLASAQMPAERRVPVRPRTPSEEPGPKGEKKLRWICKQLGLDEKQRQQAEALLATYNAQLAEDQKDPQALMVRLQAKVAEMQAAKEKGDTALVQKIQGELKNMAPGLKAENDYFDALSQVLTEEQKAKLPAVRAKAEVAGNVSLRPVHVLWAARHQSLTAEQERGLEQVLEAYRVGLATERDQSPEALSKKVDQLVHDVRALLTPAQAEKYDKEIEDLRDGAPAPERMQWPAPKQPPTPPAPPIVPGPKAGTPTSQPAPGG